MYLADIRDWLKSKIEANNYFIAKLGTVEEKSIVVYARDGNPPNIAVGGLHCTGYAVKAIKILVHATENADMSERYAKEVYNAFAEHKQIKIAGLNIVDFKMEMMEPIHLGTDDNNIFEFIINVDIIYERRNENE